jgi:predicted flavoprotein YhiN
LEGVRAQAQASLLDKGKLLRRESGELQFRKGAVSGIAVFNLSRFARVGMELSINLLPEYASHAPAADGPDKAVCTPAAPSAPAATAPAATAPAAEDFNAATRTAIAPTGASTGELEDLLRTRLRRAAPGTTAAAFLTGMLHSRLATAVCAMAGVDAAAELNRGMLAALQAALSDFRLTVSGLPTAKQAQAFRGGYATSGFDPRTLESRVYPGLHACGECLDVDGPCGGYNLHWAWASGMAAGRAAASP